MSDWRSDLVEILTSDHHKIEDLFSQLEAPISPQRKAELVTQVINELLRHSSAEEQWLYPSIRATRAVRMSAAGSGLAEHIEIKQTIRHLQAMRPGEPGYSRMVRFLIADVRAHVQVEERELFPHFIAATAAQRPRHKIGKARRTARATPA